MVYLSAEVTYPSSNRAQCRTTLLIKTNTLTNTPCHHFNMRSQTIFPSIYLIWFMSILSINLSTNLH